MCKRLLLHIPMVGSSEGTAPDNRDGLTEDEIFGAPIPYGAWSFGEGINAGDFSVAGLQLCDYVEYESEDLIKGFVDLNPDFLAPSKAPKAQSAQSEPQSQQEVVIPIINLAPHSPPSVEIPISSGGQNQVLRVYKRRPRDQQRVAVPSNANAPELSGTLFRQGFVNSSPPQAQSRSPVTQLSRPVDLIGCSRDDQLHHRPPPQFVDSTVVTAIKPNNPSMHVEEVDELMEKMLIETMQCSRVPDHLKSSNLELRHHHGSPVILSSDSEHGLADQCSNYQESASGNNWTEADIDRFLWGEDQQGNDDAADSPMLPRELPAEQQVPDNINGLIQAALLQAQEPKLPRLRWTPELHDKFLAAIETLGGLEKATPKVVLEIMDCPEITIFNVKSHLQKYRMQMDPATPTPPMRFKDFMYSRKRPGPPTADFKKKQKLIQDNLQHTIQKYKDLSDAICKQNLQMREMLSNHPQVSLNVATTLQASSTDVDMVMALPQPQPGQPALDVLSELAASLFEPKTVQASLITDADMVIAEPETGFAAADGHGDQL